ncbi:hypothetical protein [Aureibacter tunicatorum]|uniref:Uncharacterized protein n=1 Tax=Aureibacter tunicatorum TaxID=866807 RepID=A0AAE3XNH4_9BACT|nr:hypothetical protein [Aureibacter tunicatorum]MDR6240197.1 hypothetical protein [Aureibacter tunicatorum]
MKPYRLIIIFSLLISACNTSKNHSKLCLQPVDFTDYNGVRTSIAYNNKGLITKLNKSYKDSSWVEKIYYTDEGFTITKSGKKRRKKFEEITFVIHPHKNTIKKTVKTDYNDTFTFLIHTNKRLQPISITPISHKSMDSEEFLYDSNGNMIRRVKRDQYGNTSFFIELIYDQRKSAFLNTPYAGLILEYEYSSPNNSIANKFQSDNLTGKETFSLEYNDVGYPKQIEGAQKFNIGDSTGQKKLPTQYFFYKLCSD